MGVQAVPVGVPAVVVEDVLVVAQAVVGDVPVGAPVVVGDVMIKDVDQHVVIAHVAPHATVVAPGVRAGVLGVLVRVKD